MSLYLDPEEARTRPGLKLALTVGVLLYAMSSGLTLTLCAFLATMTNLILFLLIGRWDEGGLKSKLRILLEGVELGTRRVATLVPLLVCAQITLSLIALSGIGIKLSELILSVGSGHGLLLGAALALVVSMVLGMGMPTTAACPEFSYVPTEDAPAIARLLEAPKSKAKK